MIFIKNSEPFQTNTDLDGNENYIYVIVLTKQSINYIILYYINLVLMEYFIEIQILILSKQSSRLSILFEDNLGKQIRDQRTGLIEYYLICGGNVFALEMYSI